MESGAKEQPPWRGPTVDHLRLLKISEKIVSDLAESSKLKSVEKPVLLHRDLHKRNIFVSEEDPSCITAIIDWQSTSIEPTFVYSIDIPDLIDDPTAELRSLEKLMSSDDDALKPRNPEPKLEISTREDEEEDGAAAKKRYEKGLWICIQTFEVMLIGHARRLHDARAMDQTLLRPLHYCDISWRISAAALRQELIELSKVWSDLGLAGACSYQPTEEELVQHTKQYEDFEVFQQLKLFRKHALDADMDGWVPADKQDVAKAENMELFKQWVKAKENDGGSEDSARDLWPFNELSTDETKDQQIGFFGRLKSATSF